MNNKEVKKIIKWKHEVYIKCQEKQKQDKKQVKCRV